MNETFWKGENDGNSVVLESSLSPNRKGGSRTAKVKHRDTAGWQSTYGSPDIICWGQTTSSGEMGRNCSCAGGNGELSPKYSRSKGRVPTQSKELGRYWIATVKAGMHYTGSNLWVTVRTLEEVWGCWGDPSPQGSRKIPSENLSGRTEPLPEKELLRTTDPAWQGIKGERKLRHPWRKETRGSISWVLRVATLGGHIFSISM